MIIPKKANLSREELNTLKEIASDFNCRIVEMSGVTRRVYHIIGDESDELMINRMEGLEYIDRVARIQVPYKLMTVENHLEKNPYQDWKC